LRSEDLIVEIGEAEAGSMDDLQRLTGSDVIDRLVTVVIYRNGVRREIGVRLEELRT